MVSTIIVNMAPAATAVVAATTKDERREFYDRWVGTLTGFRSAPMSVYWACRTP